METPKITDSSAIKDPVRDCLLGNIDRRSFLHRLTSLGLTATAASQYWELLAKPTTSSNTSPAEKNTVSIVEGTAGEILVEQLKQCGVRFVFFNPATGDYPIFDAMLKRSDMQLIMALQEGVLTSMADGYTKASGQTSFVTCARPGFPNTLAHMFNAYKDRTPMIVAIGQTAEISRGRWGFQEVDELTKAAEPFTRWRWESRRTENLAEDLRRAFKFAATSPSGPTFLTIPTDLLQNKSVKTEIIDQSQFTLSGNVRPDVSEVEKVAQQLLESNSPILFVGSEVSRLGAEKEVIELSELLSLPVVQESHSWTNSFPTDHPLYLGIYQSNMRYPRQVDFLLNLGGLLPAPEGNTPAIHRSTRIAEVGFDIENTGRTYPSILSSPSSAKLFSRDLIEAISARTTKSYRQKLRENRGTKTNDFTEKLRQSRERVAQHNYSNTPISHERLALELRTNLTSDSCLVSEVDSGRAGLNYLTFGHKKMGYFATTSVILGWALGAALGVKLALPDRQVVALLGDGGFMFGGDQSLWTAKRYQIPILIVVQNNGSYDAERNRIWGLGAQQSKAGKDMTCFIGAPDIQYTKLAEAFGIEGERVTDPNDLSQALKRGSQANRDGEPYLLDVVIARTGRGAESTWYPQYSLAKERKRKI